MTAYLARRVLWLLVVMLGVLVITFALVSAIPGDVAIFYAGPHASPQVIAETRHALGLDQPKVVQFFRYIGHVLQGDFGHSATLDEPVLTAILSKAPATALLAATVIVIELTMAVVIGSLAAFHRDSWLDRAVAGLAALGVSLPGFWIGIMLLYLVAFRWGVLPLGGYGSPVILYLILPALTQGLPWGFWYARILRAGLLETLYEDYVRTAHSKGLHRRKVLLRHALPNAIVPTLTIAAMDLGQLLGGIVVVETVFSWPGIGLQAYQALQNVDTPLVVGTVLFTALCISVLNIVADLLRATIDPRVRFR
jgi:peptide/nickel transport system permease protein